MLRQIAHSAGLEGWEERFDPRGTAKRLADAVPAFAGIDLDSVGDQGAELG